MYYCRICGYKSQGDFCANRKCKDFCKPHKTLEQFPAPLVYQAISNNSDTMMNRCAMPSLPCNNELTLAFATTPMQRMEKIYPLPKGLMAGTIFPELNMPYVERKRLGDYHNG